MKRAVPNGYAVPLWGATDLQKFIFDAANACVISNAGELSIVEVSCSDIVSHHCYMHVLSIISFV